MMISKVLIVEPYKEPYVAEVDDSQEATAKVFEPNGLFSRSSPDITIIETKHDFDRDYVIAAISEDGAIDHELPGNRQIDDVIIAGVFMIKKFETAGGLSVPISLSKDEISKYMKIFKEPQHFVIKTVSDEKVYVNRNDCVDYE